MIDVGSSTGILLYNAFEGMCHQEQELRKVNFPLVEFTGDTIRPLRAIDLPVGQRMKKLDDKRSIRSYRRSSLPFTLIELYPPLYIKYKVHYLVQNMRNVRRLRYYEEVLHKLPRKVKPKGELHHRDWSIP